MINKSPGHIHKLLRHTYKTKSQVYFCVNNCSFRIQPQFALGKIVECWRCSKPFAMNVYSSSLEKPHCEECHRYKGDNPVRHRKGRRKSDEVVSTTGQPLVVVSESIGEGIVENLKDRMTALLDGTSEETPLSGSSSGGKTSEIREYKLEEEEDLL